MKIALAQINPTVGDFKGNLGKIIARAREAADKGARLVVFSELALCGYPPADFLEKPSFVARCRAALDELAAATESLPTAVLVGVALPVDSDAGKRVANAAVLLDKGRVLLEQHKRLLPFYDVFDEQRYFVSARTQCTVDLDNVRLAITICEDAWNDKSFWPRRLYTVDPVEELMREHPALLINLSASPYWHRKREMRRSMLASLARVHRVPVILVNQVGGNDSLLFDGSSLAMDAEGRIIAQAASFAEDLVLVTPVIAPPQQASSPEASFAEASSPQDSSLLGRSQISLPQFAEPVLAEPVSLVPVPFEPIPITPSLDASIEANTEDHIEDNEDAATWQALVMGTRDYVRKCGFSKVLIGLSGGVDSALVTAIAAEAMGAANVLAIGMPSPYSSEGSINDSRDLAKNLGIRFEVISITTLFNDFASALRPLCDPSVEDPAMALTQENIQPRIRGTLLMALSNRSSALVLTTGNKSEMAVGYCTLYGDMVGALAVIGDLVKTRVYAVCRWLNRNGEVIPESILSKPPSAELRPDQKDTDSLPPYDVLDPIVEAYVERYETPEQIVANTGAPLGTVQHVVRLIERSEYKRQQAAPVLKITPKSFGTGRRFPIAVKVEV